MKLIFSVLFFLFSLVTYTQTNKVTVGKEYATNRKNAFNGFIGETQTALFAVDYIYTSKRKQELIVRKFSKADLSLIESVNIYSNPIEQHYAIPLELFFVNNQFYLFSQLDHIKENKGKVGLNIFDINCKPISFTIIDTLEEVLKNEIDIKIYEDNRGFMLHKNHLHKVANKYVIDLKSIDLNGKTLWQKELLATNSMGSISVEKIIQTKNETYILCNYGYKNMSAESTLSNKYTLWVYNSKLNFMKEIVLRLKRKWINGIDIKLTKNNELLVFGYVNDSRNFGINACFNTLIDANYEAKKVNYYKFTKADFGLFVDSKKLNKTKQLSDFYLRKLIIQDDGSFYALGEMYYKYVDRIYDPRTNISTTTTNYFYNSILVSYFNKDGLLMWQKRVPKMQTSTEDYGFYSSFTALNLSENKIALYYNDNEKNFNYKVTDYINHKELYNNRRHQPISIIINNDGTMTKQILLTSKTNFMLYPKQSNPLSEDEIYLKSEYGRHSKIMKVVY